MKSNIHLHFNNEIRKIRENSQLRNMAESHRLAGSKIYRNGNYYAERYYIKKKLDLYYIKVVY